MFNLAPRFSIIWITFFCIAMVLAKVTVKIGTFRFDVQTMLCAYMNLNYYLALHNKLSQQDLFLKTTKN